MKKKSSKVKFVIVIVVAIMLAIGLGAAMTYYTLNSESKEEVSASQVDYNVNDYIKLCDYSKEKVYKASYEVSDEEVKEEIASALKEATTYEDVTNRVSKKGDYLLVNYSFVNEKGDCFDGCEGDEFRMEVGSELYDDALNNSMVGVKTDDTIKVDTVIPQDISSEFGGEKATAVLSVLKVQEKHEPKYDSNFVKQYTEFTTQAEYETAVRSAIQDNEEVIYRAREKQRLFDYVVDHSEYPKAFTDEMIAEATKDFEKAAKSYADEAGVSTKEVLTDYFGVTEESKKEIIKTGVKQRLVIRAISEKEGFKFSEDDFFEFVKREMLEDSQASDTEITDDDVKEYIAESDKEELKFSEYYEAVLNTLYNSSNFEIVSTDTYDEMFSENEELPDEMEDAENVMDSDEELDSNEFDAKSDEDEK